MDVSLIFKTSSGKRRTLARTLPVTIGRGRDAGLKIPDDQDTVSRRHCEVLLDDQGRVCIRDLKSSNGTVVDGRELPPEAATPVRSGAGVRLGQVSFRIEYEAIGRTEPERIAGGATAAAAGAAVPEPAEPDAITAGDAALPATEPLRAAELEADEPAMTGDFGFLSADEPAAEASGDGWLVADEGPAAADDDNLDDFFKGLQ